MNDTSNRFTHSSFPQGGRALFSTVHPPICQLPLGGRDIKPAKNPPEECRKQQMTGTKITPEVRLLSPSEPPPRSAQPLLQHLEHLALAHPGHPPCASAQIQLHSGAHSGLPRLKAKRHSCLRCHLWARQAQVASEVLGGRTCPAILVPQSSLVRKGPGSCLRMGALVPGTWRIPPAQVPPTRVACDSQLNGLCRVPPRK